MRKFLGVVAVANSRQLLDHVGLAGQRFWVSWAPRLAVRSGGAYEGQQTGIPCHFSFLQIIVLSLQ